MRGKIYSKQEKEDVKRMVIQGKSYNEIAKVLGVPKSTTSTWFGKTLKRPRTREEMLDHLSIIRKLAGPALKKKWREKNQKEMSIIKNRIQGELMGQHLKNPLLMKSMLSMLYWAEGTKKSCGVNFANTDPELMLLFITLLRNCFKLDENKFKIGLHIHYYHSPKKTKAFWSNLLNIPPKHFYKIYIKKRSKAKKFRKNFAGICFVYYKNNLIKKEILEFGFGLQKNIVNFPKNIATNPPDLYYKKYKHRACSSADRA